MPELPKSVIERLRSRPAAQQHPDADLLTAFSEQALTGRERESVLEHLAVCADCREAVALALPEVPAERPVAGFVPWYRRPQIFAWSGIAATVVVAVSLVANYGLRRQAPSAPTMERRAEVPPTANVTSAAKPEPASAIESKNGALDADRAKVKEMQTPPSPQKQAEAAPSAQALMLKKGAKAAKEESRYAMAAAPSPPAEKPLAKDGKVEAAERDQRADHVAAQFPAPKPTPPLAAMDSAMAAKNQAASVAETGEVQTAAPPTAKSAGVVGGLAAESHAVQLSKAKADKISAVSRWSISESGHLQRSMDAGRTWQPVTVDRQAGFRAVAVVGTDVWAGGPAALLYHSSDNGSHWTRQTLPGSAATIVSLDFSDAQRGAARTADGAAWSTSDGGQHWTKQ